MDTQDALNEVVPETEDGGNGAFVEPGDPSRASRRAWAFLAVLFWFEAAWAASFFGWTIAYWAAYPSAFAPHFILSVEHMVRITDTPRMALYLAFIGLAATLLAGTGFLVWRSRSSPRATFDFAVGRGVLWAQPLLVVLVIDTGIAVAYNWDMNGLTASFPAFSIPVFVGMIVFATVFLLSLARALSTTRWLVSAGATVVIVATVLVPLFAVGGYFGVEGSFSSIDALPTGRSTLVPAVDCPFPHHCVAAGSNLIPFGIPLRYLTVVAVTGPKMKWKATTFPLGLSRSVDRQSLESGPGLSIACPTRNKCLAIGFWFLLSSQSNLPLPIWRSEDGGLNWTVTSVGVPGGEGSMPHALACMNASDCAAISGAALIATRDGGTHWKVIVNRASTALLNPTGVMSCPTSRDCIAVLSTFVNINAAGTKTRLLTTVTSTKDGGLTWTSKTVVGLPSELESLACWDATNCLLGTSDSSVLYVTADRGVRWERLPGRGESPGLGLGHIQCVARQECLAIMEDSVVKTTNGGKTWTTLLRVGRGFGLFTLSCSTVNNCVAGGDSQANSTLSAMLWATQDGGRTWVRQPFPILPVPRGLRPCPFGACSTDS